MSTSPLERSLEDRLSLRERKKLKTRRSIQEHALRLFLDQGYDATTVEQIAEAAEVSPSTFFRYFPTKEDTILTDEYDPMIVESLRTQPAELSPGEAMRAMLHEIVGAMYAGDQQRILDRSRFMLSVPSLRARQREQMEEAREIIGGALAERTGRAPDDFEIRAFAAAVIGVWEMTVLEWMRTEATANPLAMLDRGLDFVLAGCPL